MSNDGDNTELDNKKVVKLALIQNEGPTIEQADNNLGGLDSKSLGIGDTIGRLKEIIEPLEEKGVRVNGRPKMGLGLKRNIEDGRENIVLLVNKLDNNPNKLANVSESERNTIVDNVRNSVDKYEGAEEILLKADKDQKQGRMGIGTGLLGGLAVAVTTSINFGATKGLAIAAALSVPEVVPVVLGVTAAAAGLVGYYKEKFSEDKTEVIDEKVSNAKGDFSHVERILTEAKERGNSNNRNS